MQAAGATTSNEAESALRTMVDRLISGQPISAYR